MFTKKSLVMLGVKNEEEKAVLSLEKKEDMYEGRIRLYNFNDEPKGILSIGFYNQNNVVKAGLSRSSSMLYTFKTEVQNISDNFSCAVVNFFQGDIQPVLYGNTEGRENKLSQLGKIMTTTFDAPMSIEEVKESLDDNKVDYTEEYKREIEEEIDKNMCVNCANCKYKQAFYSQNSNIEQEKEENLKEEKSPFFMEIKERVEDLFENNTREEYLEEIIPNSKWVKVGFDDEGDYYILGLIYEEQDLKYVVYGVPGIYQKNPPREIAGYPVWFPLDKDKPESFGYWLSYQDAKTGDSIKAMVE